VIVAGALKRKLTLVSVGNETALLRVATTPQPPASAPMMAPMPGAAATIRTTP
jgi:hypothetical protein